MAHSYSSCYEHAVFSSKRRLPFLDKNNEIRLFGYLTAAINHSNCTAINVGGHFEHVHLLYRKGKDVRTDLFLKEIKRQSSIWIKKAGLVTPDFYWQTGYGAFSISHWDIDKIKTYIDNQEEHHCGMSWEKEYRELLKKHGIEYDVRFFLD